MGEVESVQMRRNTNIGRSNEWKQVQVKLCLDRRVWEKNK